jgi:protein-S-isoprenylcysteine O-methyltransferase Ste14
MPASTAVMPPAPRHPSGNGAPRRRVWVLQPRPSVANIVTVVVLLAAFFTAFSFAAPTHLSLALGLPLMFLGIAIRFVTNSVLRKNQEICRDGLYAVSRHPMYVGSISLATGIAIVLNHALGFGLIAAVIAISIYRIRKEERFLLANLPGYGEYRREVPMFPTPRSLVAAVRGGRLKQAVSLQQCFMNGEVYRLNLYVQLLPASGLYLRHLGKLDLPDGVLVAGALAALTLTALSAWRHPDASPRSRLDYLVPAAFGLALVALALIPG